MQDIHSVLNITMQVMQFLAAAIGMFYLIRLKNSYWKWFSVYLIIILAQELFWRYNPWFSASYRTAYFVFFGVPLQFIFLYWLYAYKSLKNKRLFILSVLGYVLTLAIFTFFKELNDVLSLSFNFGSIILIVLLILEFVKQIQTDAILRFKENKMFYINLGLILFYIGNYPYHVFSVELYENYRSIWSMYYIYFLFANCIMYLLFSVSFIWGKTQS